VQKHKIYKNKIISKIHQLQNKLSIELVARLLFHLKNIDVCSEDQFREENVGCRKISNFTRLDYYHPRRL
jgi:hypothetical protein